MTPTLRLLIDSASDGPTNMARDEALLDAVCEATSTAVLRFYAWREPTVSLGYFQPFAEFESSCDAATAVVRRTTGGGAILHDRELTYCLAVGRRHALLADGPTNLYRLMHDAVIAVMHDLGLPARLRGQGGDEGPEPFFCFARAHTLDVVVADAKLAGSAQRRKPDGVLQHGSILLDPVGEHCQIAPDALARRIAARFAEDTRLSLLPDDWTATEHARAKHHATRYNAPAWTRRC